MHFHVTPIKYIHIYVEAPQQNMHLDKKRYVALTKWIMEETLNAPSSHSSSNKEKNAIVYDMIPNYCNYCAGMYI